MRSKTYQVFDNHIVQLQSGNPSLRISFEELKVSLYIVHLKSRNDLQIVLGHTDHTQL